VPIRCARCGAEFDVALFPFGREVACECGATVRATDAHAPAPPWPMAVVMSRAGCHLCDVAKAALAARGVGFTEIDVDSDPDLRARFGEEVPVVFLEGKKRFVGRIDEALLARWLRAKSRDREGG